MTIGTLNRANAIKKTIDKLEIEHSRISKFYSKIADLSKEELIEIAMVNTSYAVNRFKDELKQL
jgi:coenzyme F420-reducing hydrogenase delta subunit